MKTLLMMTFLLLTTTGVAQNGLTVKFTDFPQNKGTLMVAVFKEGNFLRAPSFAKKTPVNKDTVVVKFKKLPSGPYAISAFQDLNHNHKLDFTKKGIPSEPYGLSQNPILRGRPKWSDVKFELEKAPKTLIIKMK